MPLAVASTDPLGVTAAFRTGLGATFTFLSDDDRAAIKELDIVEITKPGFKHGHVAVPYTFSLLCRTREKTRFLPLYAA